jgi:hypothetical protein
LNRLTSVARVSRIALALLVLTVTPRVGSAQEAPKPLPPDGTAYGLMLTDWAVAFELWGNSLPGSANPGLWVDKETVNATIGQHAPVWFIPYASGPASGGSGTRTLRIPAGMSIFLQVASAGYLDQPGLNEEQFRELVRKGPGADLDRITVLEVTLDGVSIPDVKRYRVETPLFSVTSVLTIAGKDAHAVGIVMGYYLLFPPLPVGKHVLTRRVEGSYATGARSGGNPVYRPFKDEWTLNLLIHEPNQLAP